MLLATRCPFCETVFRLQPGQLSLRRGLVRCGHCQEVFDASSSLYEAAEGVDFSTAALVSPAAVSALSADAGANAPPKAPNFSAEAWNPWAPQPDATIDQSLLHNATNLPLAPVAASVAVTPQHADERQMRQASAEAAAAPEPEAVLAASAEPPGATSRHAVEAAPEVAPEAAPEVASKVAPEAAPEVASKAAPQPKQPLEHPENKPALEDEAQAAAAILRSAPDPEPHFGTAAAAPPFAANPAVYEDDPFPVVRETRAPAPRRLGWRIAGGLVAVLLLLGLLAQLAWWQRETIMVDWPDSQALYAQACAPLGCTVMPPHAIDGLQVEPSDLRQIDGPHKLELKMPLRNRYNVALAYPAIELTLLDDQNNVAVRRVLWPQDYVKPGTPIEAGLPARTTQTMIVHLDTGNTVATNFRVQIFYP